MKTLNSETVSFSFAAVYMPSGGQVEGFQNLRWAQGLSLIMYAVRARKMHID